MSHQDTNPAATETLAARLKAAGWSIGGNPDPTTGAIWAWPPTHGGYPTDDARALAAKLGLTISRDPEDGSYSAEMPSE